MCLRAQMPGVVQPSSATVEATPAAPAATTVGTPALDTTKPEVPPNLIAATFGLLRAEPDGSVVIAGSGTPGTDVEVYANGALLGSTKVEKSGDWVMVPEAPIAPGGTEITLGEAGSPARADKSFVVVINEDRKSEPLVVASTPGAASEVLQGLTHPAASQMATAEPAKPAAAAETVVASAPATAPETAPAAAAATPMAAAEPAAPMAVATAEVPAVPAAPVASATDAAPTQVATVEAPAAAVPVAETPAGETPAAVVAAAPAVAQPEAPVPVAEAAPAVAVQSAPVAVAPVTVVPPTIDAIEMDSGKTFFAGSAADGATIRLYVDDQYIADTIARAGRWLVEAGDVLTKPSQRIRVDLLNPDSAEVAARAEVNFEVDIKATPTEPVAVANAEAPAASVTVAPQGTQTTPTVATDAAPVVPTPALEVASAATPVAAPAAATAEGATPAAMATETAVAPVEVAVAAPVAVATEPATETVVATASQADVPTIVATQVGDVDAQRFAFGKAIIRHGDNLWTIARRVYGAGIKYTTIYEANTDQIRDPDRIYPGQVFDLPKASAN